MLVGKNIKRIRTINRLTQQEFANHLGLKRNTVATYEMGRSEPSEAAKMLICREFSVRREWLETGQGEMFLCRDDSIMARLAREYHLDERSRTLIENFLRLTPENREMVLAAFDNAARLLNNRPLTKREHRKADSELTREEMQVLLDKELDAQEAAKRGKSP